MTAILEDLRRLDAARKRGELSPDAYEDAKRRLLGDVEDVQIVAESRPRPQRLRTARAQMRGDGMWSLLLLGMFGVGILTLITALVVGDMTIAVTLVVTIFAAILVKAAKRLEH